MTNKDRDELKRLEAEATLGPWAFDEEIQWINRGDEDPEVHTGNFDVSCEGGDTTIANVNGQIAEGKANAAFIAAARNAVPDLLAENERMRELLENIQWAEWEDSDHGTQRFCTACRNDAKYGHYPECKIGEFLAEGRE